MPYICRSCSLQQSLRSAAFEFYLLSAQEFQQLLKVLAAVLLFSLATRFALKHPTQVSLDLSKTHITHYQLFYDRNKPSPFQSDSTVNSTKASNYFGRFIRASSACYPQSEPSYYHIIFMFTAGLTVPVPRLQLSRALLLFRQERWLLAESAMWTRVPPMTWVRSHRSSRWRWRWTGCPTWGGSWGAREGGRRDIPTPNSPSSSSTRPRGKRVRVLQVKGKWVEGMCGLDDGDG